MCIRDRDYVVTAAHCMYFKDTGTYANPRKIWITAGTTDLEDRIAGSSPEQMEVNKFKQVTRVSEIIPHPKFEYRKHEADLGTIPTYDIALLKLSPPLKLNERTQPIALAPKGY